MVSLYSLMLNNQMIVTSIVIAVIHIFFLYFTLARCVNARRLPGQIKVKCVNITINDVNIINHNTNATNSERKHIH